MLSRISIVYYTFDQSVRAEVIENLLILGIHGLRDFRDRHDDLKF